jgi:hypothetical protein
MRSARRWLLCVRLAGYLSSSAEVPETSRVGKCGNPDGKCVKKCGEKVL